jgi:hypothetical protein
MRTLASGETDPTVIAQAFRTIPPPGSVAGNMVVLNGSALVPPALLPVDAAATMINGLIAADVAGNALTLTIATLAGAAPSTDDPVIIIFRSLTPGSAKVFARQITSALSITIPSGATLGHSSARDQQFILYGIDNAGVVELAVATPLFDQSVRLKTTTTIGAGSTSATGFYSTTGRSNLPWSPIARCVSNQTTAGTWTAVPTQIDSAPFSLPPTNCRVYLASDQTGVAGSTFTKVNLDTADVDPSSLFDSTNKRITPKVPGTYEVLAGILFTGPTSNISGAVIVAIAKNGSRVGNSGIPCPAGTDDARPITAGLMAFNGTTDFVETQGFAFLSGGTVTFSGNIATTWLYVVRVGP